MRLIRSLAFSWSWLRALYARFWLAFAFWLWLHYSWRLAWSKADRRSA